MDVPERKHLSSCTGRVGPLLRTVWSILIIRAHSLFPHAQEHKVNPFDRQVDSFWIEKCVVLNFLIFLIFPLVFPIFPETNILKTKTREMLFNQNALKHFY